MTVGSDFRVSLPALGTAHANYGLGLDVDSLGSPPRMFKKHKVLPHPRKDDAPRSSLLRYSLANDASLSLAGPLPTPLPKPSPSGRQRASRPARGPEPPPTPPAHSRTSSASHPADPSSSKSAATPPDSTVNVESRPPVTPPIQQTPPTPNLTPDRTPPGPAAGLSHRRPPLTERNSSKVTTDSRAESFRTAPENPCSSDDDDGRPILRPALPSGRSSQSTVRRANGGSRSVSQPVGLGLGLESSLVDDATPRTVLEFNAFDGEWTSGEAGTTEPAEWDYNLMRNVTLRKRRPTRPAEIRNEVLDDRTVTPTNATKALRSVSLQESPILHTRRRVVSDRMPAWAAPSTSESPTSVDNKRSSVMSTRSNASTVVEAVLVETAPQRRKTLRHVRKQSALRDSSSEITPPSSAPTSVSPAAGDRRQRPELVSTTGDAARESSASTVTYNSISSRKARRSVWKSGGIPVVVIPDRRSSVGSNSKTPSLRSTSSRRSRSLSSVPISQPSKSGEHVPLFERPVRRSRTLSESDGSQPGDQRTMDFPPVIPARSSSLSAPTSRNVSRTGSLTAESLKAHNVFQAQQAHNALQKASRELDKLHHRAPPSGEGDRRDRKGPDSSPKRSESERQQPSIAVERAAREDQSELGESPTLGRRERNPHDTRVSDSSGLRVDRDGDPFFGNRLSVQNTPLSVGSVETAATSHAELSEAMAVNIYPHQSKSVVLVNHSAKPSESSSLDQYKTSATAIPAKTADANHGVPATPPQQFSIDDVDSPLRNPRAPPKPPAINFTPATPSGLTPSVEKNRQLGNYYEITAEKPKRSMSLLRRTLTRRTSEYGPAPPRPTNFLTRTFSLSRNVRRSSPDDWAHDRPRLKRRSTADSAPRDETRLHPHWRPAYAEDSDDSYSSDEDSYLEDDDDSDGHGSEDRTYRYPPIDNRPSPAPRRTLSARIKRTFAILPLARGGGADGDGIDDEYPATAHDAPDRRTIRRTPSGNLRVMKFRRSMESLTRVLPVRADGRPGTAPEMPPNSSENPGRGRRIWREISLRARSSLRKGGSVPPAGVVPAAAAASTVVGGRAIPAGAASSASAGNATAAAPPASTTTSGSVSGFRERINIPRRLSKRRRERRTQALRGMISAPREVRDGVGEVLGKGTQRGTGTVRGGGVDVGGGGGGGGVDRDAVYVREQQAERRRREGRV